MAEDRSRLQPERRALLAVYEDQTTALGAMQALDALPDAGEVLVGDEARPVDSLIAEMQQEADDAFISPQVAVVYPKESLRSSTIIGPPLIGLLALLFLPLGFVPIGDVDLWIRLVGAAIAGAACGGAILLVVGPAMGVKRAMEPAAAQRGIAVRLDGWSPDAEEALIRPGLIRLDVVDREGRENGWPVASQDTSKGLRIIDEVRRNAQPADNDDIARPVPEPDRTVRRQG